MPVPYFDPRGAEGEPSGNVLGGVLHALRRRWFAIAFFGLISGAGAAAAAWYLLERQYTAVIRLHIPARDESLFIANQGQTGIDYDLKKRSEVQNIAGFYVLERAWTQDSNGFSKFQEFRELPPEGHLAYLKSCVTATFPQNADIMELRVRCKESKAAELLAKEVTRVYLDLQQRELQTKEALVANLEKTYLEYKDKYAERQRFLTSLKEGVANDADQKLTAEEKKYEQDYLSYRQQIERLQSDILENKLELNRLEGAANVELPPLVSDEELHAASELDPHLKAMRRYLKTLQEQAAKLPEGLFGQGLSTAQKTNEQKQEKTREQISDRTEELRKELELKKQVVKKTPEEVRANLAVLEKMLAEKESDPPKAPPLTRAAGRW
ncbi:MAG: hypothetical protein U0992_04315 [Planctomycetaceae bacterium]